jgi:hypothetical protein
MYNAEFQDFNYQQPYEKQYQQQQPYDQQYQSQQPYDQQYQQQQPYDQQEKVSFQSIKAAFSTGDYPNEEPLLVELGINFSHIFTKGTTVLNPLRPVDPHILDDSDLAGPLLFCLMFGIFLLLAGKAHFGYIYGVALMGWITTYCILNLMTEPGIDAARTASVLGYSLLPMVILGSVSAFLNLTFVFFNLVAILAWHQAWFLSCGAPIPRLACLLPICPRLISAC